MSSTICTLGAGCFWGVEKAFRKKFPTILETAVGYCGGNSNNTNYKEVCTGKTNHAEVVQFKTSNDLSYETVLEFFFRMHDPTTVNQQGNDRGTQYRSVIFYHDDKQKETAFKVIAQMNEVYGGKIKTTVEPFNNWVKAEDYHQEYLAKNPHGYECATHFERSIESIKKQYLANQ
jgi:peptide-methionine (S)-S-oxide reductase